VTVLVPANRDALYDSLALFDRPERERLRNFLPRGADVDQLVRDLFAQLDAPETR
jgi:hypothetical protein